MHLPAICDITAPMKSIFDAPMGLLQGQQARGVGFVAWQISQSINSLLTFFVSFFDISS